MQTLTQLIASLQSLLSDDGTIFTNALATAAIRQALKDFNTSVPIHAAEVMPAVSGQYEYPLTDTTALSVTDVLKQGTDSLAENHVKLPFNAYWEDGLPIIRLHTAQGSGYIIVRYTTPHTINGLDGSTESTLSAFMDGVLLDAACARSAQSRAANRIEQINLNPAVAQTWTQTANTYQMAYAMGLIILQRQQPADIGNDVNRTMAPPSWNDQFHNPADDRFTHGA